MEIKRLDYDLTVCKVDTEDDIVLGQELCFVARTDEEISLVCLTENTPDKAVVREDGWRAFRIQGILDFSLIGILSRIAAVLAENGIGIFAVSTYNTDYILVKKENFDKALTALQNAGYSIV